MKSGQSVIVTDANGKETKGTVADLSTSTLVLRTPEPVSFSESRIASIRRTDSLWNGIVIGAAAGGALALAGFASTQGNSDSVYGWAYVGSWLAPAAGGAVGALVDRSIGTAPVYMSSPTTSKVAVAVSPLLTVNAAGASVSISFERR